ncbi:MAG: acetyl-CoA carboxylase carboxyltransferase subunit alpha [Pseudomonadota bacterium]|nr:acetyl-CoA carboxylase carboxyltransferase subunit alpha [Pseudomonadota bacterium]MEC9391933.1 acetyl-CoA carboxylase carboxyltransferase subunit alpha [Pseudomonadota bacterium]MED5436771.1 acetyl-CoA carboxylase carboxyltransferase subunit alpha [Pseudomonadota bacterium]
MVSYLDFEKPLSEIEGKIRELNEARLNSDNDDISLEKITNLEKKAQEILSKLYNNLGTWEKTQVARHANRPHFSNYIEGMIDNFIPLSGDRLYGDDNAIIGGLGKLSNSSVMLIGHEKGNDTKTRLKHNFGMAHPEGYRKSIRLMNLAEKYNIPVITFIDTPGAYPGIGAEERGQSEAIARSTDCTLSLKVPVISIVIGEGGSGGAIALAAANKVLMLEHAIYTVASPEASASILWRSSAKAKEAAIAMKITSQDLLKLGVIDKIIDEPIGGAHREHTQMITQTKLAILESLSELNELDSKELIKHRREKFLKIGENL